MTDAQNQVGLGQLRDRRGDAGGPVGVVIGGPGLERDDGVREPPLLLRHHRGLLEHPAVVGPVDQRGRVQRVGRLLGLVVDEEAVDGGAAADGGAVLPGGVLVGVQDAERGEAVEGVVVLVAPVEGAGVEELAAAQVLAVVHVEEHGLQVLGLVGIEGGVEVGPAEEARLVAGEDVGLRAGRRPLGAGIRAVEVEVPFGHRPVAGGVRPVGVGRQVRGPGAGDALVDFLALEAVGAEGQGGEAVLADRAPVVVDRAAGRVHRVDRLRGAGAGLCADRFGFRRHHRLSLRAGIGHPDVDHGGGRQGRRCRRADQVG